MSSRICGPNEEYPVKFLIICIMTQKSSYALEAKKRKSSYALEAKKNKKFKSSYACNGPIKNFFDLFQESRSTVYE